MSSGIPPFADPPRIASVSVAPECCDEPMAEITTPFDRTLRAWRFECVVCGFLMLAVEDEPPAPAPSGPTGHAAGSEAKLVVLMERARRGQALFHAGDNPALARISPSGTGGAADAHVRRSVRAMPRGVRQRRGRFEARIWREGKWVSLGLFATAEEASSAVRRAEAR